MFGGDGCCDGAMGMQTKRLQSDNQVGGQLGARGQQA